MCRSIFFYYIPKFFFWIILINYIHTPSLSILLNGLFFFIYNYPTISITSSNSDFYFHKQSLSILFNIHNFLRFFFNYSSILIQHCDLWQFFSISINFLRFYFPTRYLSLQSNFHTLMAMMTNRINFIYTFSPILNYMDTCLLPTSNYKDTCLNVSVTPNFLKDHLF